MHSRTSTETEMHLPPSEDRRREEEIRIGTAIRNAQYALTIGSSKQLPTAMAESYTAVQALSAYLSLPNGSPKGAATAKRIGKLWKDIMKLTLGNTRSLGSEVQTEVDNDDESTHTDIITWRSDGQYSGDIDSVDHQIPMHNHELELEELKQSLTQIRHEMALKETALDQTRNENEKIGEALRAAEAKITLLNKSLNESQETLHSMAKLNDDLRCEVDKLHSEVILVRESLQTQITEYNLAFKQRVDKDELDGYKLQVQLLRQALREASMNNDAKDLQAGKKTLADIEADHQEQLLAMKCTIAHQYKSEELFIKEAKNLTEQIQHMKLQQQNIEQMQQQAQKINNHIEERHREQVATLEATLEQEREQHAAEIVSLQTALSSAAQRAEEVELAARESAGSAEQRHREQVATLEAALEQEREQHAAEIVSLQTALSSAAQRAEEVELAARESAGSAEQHHREQVATLETALEQEREKHKAELKKLSRCMKVERAEIVNKEIESLSRRHEEEVASLKEEFGKERSAVSVRVIDLCSQRDVLKDKMSTLERKFEANLREAEKLRGIIEEQQRHKKSVSPPKSPVGVFPECMALREEVSVLRSKCYAAERGAADAYARARERDAAVRRLVDQLGAARADPAHSVVPLHDEALRALRESVLVDLRLAMRRGAGDMNEHVDSDGEALPLMRALLDAVARAGAAGDRAALRVERQSAALSAAAARQTVALRKVRHCLGVVPSARAADAPILEACLLLLNDVALDAGDAAPHGGRREGDDGEALVQKAVQRALHRASGQSPPARQRVAWRSPQASLLRPIARDHALCAETGGEDAFGFAVATLSAQERRHARQQSTPSKRWIA